MIRLRHKLLIHALRIHDQLVMIAALFLTLELTRNQAGSAHVRDFLQGTYGARESMGTAVLLIGWFYIFNRLVRYETDRLRAFKAQVIDLTKATSLSAFYLMIVSAVFGFRRVNTEAIAIVWAASTVIGIGVRLLIRAFLMYIRRSGYSYRHMLILGVNARSIGMAARIDRTPILGYKIAGFIAEGPNPPATQQLPHPLLGTADSLQRVLENGTVDEMIICVDAAEHFGTVWEAIRLSEQLGIVVRIFADPSQERIFRRFHLERFEGEYVVTLFREQMLLQLLLKRLIDFCGAAVLLLLLSPILLVVALAIKLSTPGPVFFVQERVGMNKRRFKLYKFRSMYIDAEKRRRELEHLNEMDGPVFKIKNDPRITPIGRFIRKTSIDELPQLVNVFRGHMSLVGPRPPLPAEVDQYEWLYRKRLSIKPGITCLWQISGRNEITFQQWMEMDRTYIENWSVWLDLRILAKTIPTVLLGRGAS